MTSNKYRVRNCPCYTSKGGYYDCWANQDTWCENITDCVIKQVIEIAKDIIEKDCYENSDAKAEKILQLFDIEEINE